MSKLTKVQHGLLNKFGGLAVAAGRNPYDFDYIDDQELADWLAHDPDDENHFPDGIDNLTEALVANWYSSKSVEMNQLICKLVNNPTLDTVNNFVWELRQLVRDETIKHIRSELKDRFN